MDRYYCVFKMPDYLPVHTSFESANPATAIQKMMEMAKVTSTIEIEEAEILKYMGRSDDGKPLYTKVFSKLKKEEKGKLKLQASPPPVINVPVVEEQLDVYKKPYTIEVL